MLNWEKMNFGKNHYQYVLYCIFHWNWIKWKSLFFSPLDLIWCLECWGNWQIEQKGSTKRRDPEKYWLPLNVYTVYYIHTNIQNENNAAKNAKIQKTILRLFCEDMVHVQIHIPVSFPKNNFWLNTLGIVYKSNP